MSQNSFYLYKAADLQLAPHAFCHAKVLFGFLVAASLSSGQSDAPQRVSLDLSDFMDPVSNDDNDDTKKRKKLVCASFF